MSPLCGNPSAAFVSIRAHATRSFAAALGLALTLVATDGARAQSINISMHDHAPDSVAQIVPRQRYDVANAKVRSRDRSVMLLLTDTTLVLQLSQREMDRIEIGVNDAKSGESLAARLVARVVGAGVTELLDHGISYRLSALRSARAEGNRLILEDRDGHRVFENVEVNHSRFLEDLPPDDARRFAADVNRAIARLR